MSNLLTKQNTFKKKLERNFKNAENGYNLENEH